jgi:chromosome segregation ATPase
MRYALCYPICYEVNVMAGVTAEQVIAAAEAIAAQGDRPSVRAIRDRLETGSFNTIQRYLSEWRETRPLITQAAYELPAQLANDFGKELRRGAEAATAELRAELSEAHAETKERAKEGEALESQLSELTEVVDALTHERDTAAAEAAARADEIRRLSEQLSDEKRAAESARTEVATARVKIETQTEQITDIKQQAEKQADELKQRISAGAEKLDTARTGQQDAERAAAVAASEVKAESRRADQAEQRETATAEGLQGQIGELKKEVAEVRQETKEAHQATAGEADKWRETVALEHKRNAELQSERDALADEVANLKKQSGVSANERPTR